MDKEALKRRLTERFQGALAEALARFWETLREKSRVRIEHPDLPQPLQAAAGEMVGTLWQQAQAAGAARRVRLT